MCQSAGPFGWNELQSLLFPTDRGERAIHLDLGENRTLKTRSKPLEAVRFVSKMRGNSQSVLVDADDGRRYVAKFLNNPQGPNVLFNEFVGTNLLGRCGVLVPPCGVLRISDAFIDANPGCWMVDNKGQCVRPNSGLCFGSVYLGPSRLPRPYAVLPRLAFEAIRNRKEFWRVWVIDILAQHVDTRQAFFFGGYGSRLTAVFHDQGHYFGGPDQESHQTSVTCTKYPDVRIYPQLTASDLLRDRRAIADIDCDRVWRTVDLVPQEWTTQSAVRGLSQCLDNLARPVLVGLIQDAITEHICQIARRIGRGYGFREGTDDDRTLCSILSGGLPVGVRESAKSERQLPAADSLSAQVSRRRG